MPTPVTPDSAGNASDTSSPTFPQILQMAIDLARAGVRVGLPGIVQAYDRATQRAEVQVAIKPAHPGEDGAREVRSVPLLTDVPVLFMGSRGYHETFPVAPGSTGWVMFAGSSIARWKVSGGEVDPGDDRRHSVADAVFLPAGRPAPDKIAGLPEDAWVITVPYGKELRLGGPAAAQKSVLGNQLASDMNTMVDAIQVAVDAILTALSMDATIFDTAMSAFKDNWAGRLSSTVKLVP